MEIILGAAASLLVQFLKNSVTMTEYTKLLVVFAVALGVSALYASLQAMELWEVFSQVVLAAGAVYTFILARFEEGSDLRTLMNKIQ